jgi:hypothetical protein
VAPRLLFATSILLAACFSGVKYAREGETCKSGDQVLEGSVSCADGLGCLTLGYYRPGSCAPLAWNILSSINCAWQMLPEFPRFRAGTAVLSHDESEDEVSDARAVRHDQGAERGVFEAAGAHGFETPDHQKGGSEEQHHGEPRPRRCCGVRDSLHAPPPQRAPLAVFRCGVSAAGRRPQGRPLVDVVALVYWRGEYQIGVVYARS